MQVVLKALNRLKVVLSKLEDRPINITFDGEHYVLQQGLVEITVDDVSPFLPRKKVKYGVMTPNHRIEAINIITDVLSRYPESDNIFVSVEDYTFVFNIVVDNHLVEVGSVNILPMQGRFWRWVLSR